MDHLSTASLTLCFVESECVEPNAAAWHFSLFCGFSWKTSVFSLLTAEGWEWWVQIAPPLIYSLTSKLILCKWPFVCLSDQWLCSLRWRGSLWSWDKLKCQITEGTIIKVTAAFLMLYWNKIPQPFNRASPNTLTSVFLLLPQVGGLLSTPG